MRNSITSQVDDKLIDAAELAIDCVSFNTFMRAASDAYVEQVQDKARGVKRDAELFWRKVTGP